MTALFRYLFGRSLREQLPRLQTGLADSFEPEELDPDLVLVLMTGRARDIHQARQLMEKYGARNGAELLARLPPPPPVDWRKRFRAWVRQLEGAYETDPHRDELKVRREHL